MAQFRTADRPVRMILIHVSTTLVLTPAYWPSPVLPTT
jgi:hypothetical protein